MKNSEDNICGKGHHPLLHRSFNNNAVSVNSGNCWGNKAMLPVGTVYSAGQLITVLWDSGSDITLITHSMANKLGLVGVDVMMSMVKVGNITEKCVSKEYTIQVQDNAGNKYNLKAIGMDEITAQVPLVELSQVSTIFPNVNMGILVRPSGKVDTLIGTDYCELLPRVIRTEGKLQLLEKGFGYCLRGRHPLTNGIISEISNLTAIVNKAVVDLQQTSLLVE